MKDREIFKGAVHALPSLIVPLFVTLGTVQLLEYGLTALLWKMGNIELFGKSPVYIASIIGGSLLLALFFSLAGSLINLGCYRLCLARGLGKQGSMPWTILGQWRKYKSWLLWVGLLPAIWRAGKQVLRIFLTTMMKDTDIYYQIMDWKVYFGIIISIASFLLFMLLSLSVRTAYLRAPKRGFWRALIFGVAEGFRKWPKTIGPQVKYVLTVMFCFRMISGYIIVPLLVKTGIRGSLVVTQGLQLADTIWILVFYGFLAAERYDPPGREKQIPIENGSREHI